MKNEIVTPTNIIETGKISRPNKNATTHKGNPMIKPQKTLFL